MPEYNREAALEYAGRWAFARNPRYISFDGMGGDCTNFISQCIYAGARVMNYKRDVGWYYNSPRDRAAAWSGVPYLYRFLVSNRGAGPYGTATTVDQLEIGDVIQLGNNDGTWYHSLLVTGRAEDGDPLVSTHTFDAYMRGLSTYEYEQARFIKIVGVRK